MTTPFDRRTDNVTAVCYLNLLFLYLTLYFVSNASLIGLHKIMR